MTRSAQTVLLPCGSGCIFDGTVCSIVAAGAVGGPLLVVCRQHGVAVRLIEYTEDAEVNAIIALFWHAAVQKKECPWSERVASKA
eukprot:3705698-Heterocapsa_arctica.AAC.1